jgi:hypothetical protein
MPLTGEQFGELTAILCETFDWPALDHLTRVKFDIDLSVEIETKDTPFRQVADAWVRWLEQRGRTADFVGYLRAERPTAERVRRFYEAYLSASIQADRPGPTALAAPSLRGARDKIIVFCVYFRESGAQFQFLNAYKDLHDKLHTLHDMRDGIDQAADRFRAHPDDPAGLAVIAEDLKDLAEGAGKAASDLEDPADAPWIAALSRAADTLASAAKPPNPELLEQSLKVLRALPSQQQSGLNAALIRTARRLRAYRLAQTATEILALLAGAGADAAPLLAEFRARLGLFGGLCDRLAVLIQLHDSCQGVEVILAPFEAATGVTPDGVPDWAAALQRLRQLAAARPGDPRAQRMGAVAAAFDAARGRPALEEFSVLLIRFRRLFNDVDKELLAVTDDLVQQAQLLSVQLRTLANVPDGN